MIYGTIPPPTSLRGTNRDDWDYSSKYTRTELPPSDNAVKRAKMSIFGIHMSARFP